MAAAGKPFQINRHLVAGCAVACFAVALWRYFASAEPQVDFVLGGAWRVGLVLTALWWALPRQGENIVWTRAAIVVAAGVVLVVFLRRAALYVVPVVALVAGTLWFLRPKAPPPQRRGWR